MEQEKEVWRTIPSVPKYLASSFGRLMRVPFTGPMPYGGDRHYEGQPTYGVWIERYRRYIYVIDGKTYKVARLVCEAFNGPPPPGKPVCMHMDENSRNNQPGNLAWGTQKENLNAPAFVEYCSLAHGDRKARQVKPRDHYQPERV